MTNTTMTLIVFLSIFLATALVVYFLWRRRSRRIVQTSKPLSGDDYSLALGKTRTESGLGALWFKIKGSHQVTPETLLELEETLITADFGVETTQTLMSQLPKTGTLDELKSSLSQACVNLLSNHAKTEEFWSEIRQSGHHPYVLLIVGVNGAGKTTTIGKLASLASKNGLKVLIGAGDTFRAAACEQLRVWAERSGADFVSRGEGADPASVLFDALQAGKARGADLVVCDTAGRLQSQTGLMDELSKCVRTMKKVIPEAPHDIWLVIDGTMGQNALRQAKIFTENLGLTGLVLTKIDGSAKGGVVVSITRELGIPVRFVGIGEKIDQLRPFDPRNFTQAILPLDPPPTDG